MRWCFLVNVCALALVASRVDAQEFVSRTLPIHVPPRVVSAQEGKSLNPKADAKSRNVPQPSDAGKWRGAVSGQIVGGESASRGQWPWQVFVLQDNAYMCGGSLITPQFVLTAAHCAQDRSNFTLLFGAVRRNVFEDGRVQVETTLKYVHPNYSTSTLSNDVALIKLPTPLFQTSSDVIRTVRLPKSSDASKTFVGIRATASGWGRVNNSAGSTSRTLNYVSMPVISNAECAAAFGPIVVPSTICTDTTAIQSTCQGDSGGPLVYYDNSTNAWTQIGVTSFTSSTSCSEGSPAGFARVTAFLGWISNTVSGASPANASG